MTRPWVTPQEVRDYTEITAVGERTDEKLSVDIARAEERVIAITHNDFSDAKYAEAMPDAVKTAVILLAESYALNAVNKKKQNEGKYESETFDDYSCKYATGTEISESDLDLTSLLDNYIIRKPQGTVTMRMRRL